MSDFYNDVNDWYQYEWIGESTEWTDLFCKALEDQDMVDSENCL